MDAVIEQRSEDTRWWLVIAPHVWGRGPTREEAMKQARKAGMAARERRFMVSRGEKEMFVDEYGSLCWYGDTKPERVEEHGLQKVRR